MSDCCCRRRLSSDALLEIKPEDLLFWGSGSTIGLLWRRSGSAHRLLPPRLSGGSVMEAVRASCARLHPQTFPIFRRNEVFLQIQPPPPPCVMARSVAPPSERDRCVMYGGPANRRRPVLPFVFLRDPRMLTRPSSLLQKNALNGAGGAPGRGFPPAAMANLIFHLFLRHGAIRENRRGSRREKRTESRDKRRSLCL